MNSFVNFLATCFDLENKLTIASLIALTSVIHFSLVFLIDCCFKILKCEIPENKKGRELFAKPIYPYIVILMAFFEEITFRFYPIYIAMHLFGVSIYVVAIVIIISIMFGVMHGSFKNIFIQGIFGFLYSLLFLAAGGFQERYVLAIIAATISHSLNNYILYIWGLMEIRYSSKRRDIK